jgi:drug/metabolite transporter (DMT)-like permease
MIERALRLRGVLLMIAAVGTFAVMDAIMKHLTVRYPPLQVACLRGASSLPFVFGMYLATRSLGLLRPVRWSLHLVRALLAVLMLWGFLWALARASMADTYAVFMSAPILVVLCATILLRERTDWHLWLAVFAGFAGVFVMLKPGGSGFVSLAGMAALGSALAYALVVVMVRVMSSTETTASMVFWYLLLLAIGAGVLAAPAWVDIFARDWPWIAAVGLAGFAGQYLITEAFRLAPASALAPYEYMALVWGAGIDWLVWRTMPAGRMLAGAAIVVGAGLYLLHRQRASARAA